MTLISSKKTPVRNVSKNKPVSKKKNKTPRILTGTGVISSSTNKIVKPSKSVFMYVELVGTDPLNKKYVRLEEGTAFEYVLNPDRISSSMEAWKLWKSDELDEYMGTSKYEIVTVDNYPLKWVIGMSDKYKAIFEHPYSAFSFSFWTDVLGRGSVETNGGDYKGFSIKLVASESVSIPILEHVECTKCLLPRDNFYNIDNLKQVVTGTFPKLVGTCVDCVYVAKMVMKNAVSCYTCKEMVNVVGLKPGNTFGLITSMPGNVYGQNTRMECMECITNGFIKV